MRIAVPVCDAIHRFYHSAEAELSIAASAALDVTASVRTVPAVWLLATEGALKVCTVAPLLTSYLKYTTGMTLRAWPGRRDVRSCSATVSPTRSTT